MRAVADHVFDEWTSTDELYTTTIKPMVTGTPPLPAPLPTPLRSLLMDASALLPQGRLRASRER